MIDFLKQRKTVLIVIIAVVLIGGYYFYNSNQDYNTIEQQEILVNESNTTSEENDDENEFIVVHVAGCVKTPGIVKLEEGSRIEDAIEAAGGLTEDADITNINLAYVIDDGTKIKIPSVDDVSTDEDEDYIIEDGGYDEEDSSSSSSSLININTASQTELETLNGIGPSLASKIIEYRETNGDFESIEDIKNVSGIGDSKFDNIKDFIKV